MHFQLLLSNLLVADSSHNAHQICVPVLHLREVGLDHAIQNLLDVVLRERRHRFAGLLVKLLPLSPTPIPHGPHNLRLLCPQVRFDVLLLRVMITDLPHVLLLGSLVVQVTHAVNIILLLLVLTRPAVELQHCAYLHPSSLPH